MSNVSMGGGYYRSLVQEILDFYLPLEATVLDCREKLPTTKRSYDYLVVNNIVGDLEDVQKYFQSIKGLTRPRSRVVVTYYNQLWEPILKFASTMGWRTVNHEQNWLNNDDLKNLLALAGFEFVMSFKKVLLPINIPIVSTFFNNWVANLPLLNELCLITCVIAKPRQSRKLAPLSVSIVVPARNEEGNIKRILGALPKFGKWQELILVEGHSRDKTWNEILKLRGKQTKFLRIKAFQQHGVGKADAVRLGFQHATGKVLMILDADLTVSGTDLAKFYDAIINGDGEFINGSRMVYPMEKQAMRVLNKLGNKVFSWLFTWILGQRFRDTLCGTKVLFREDYLKIAANRHFFGDFDPFGDYDLIFGAIKQNLKIAEIPIRYRDRVYGSTNISRFQHGWLLLKMTWFAFKVFKLNLHENS